MSRSSGLRILLLAVLGAFLAWTGGASAEPRLALVVANASYSGSLDPLANPTNDGKLIAATLQKLGFKVTLVTDIDQKGMKRAIAKFGDELISAGSTTSALFYFAGHGLQVDGENYLVPLNASISKEADVDIEAVSASSILKQMEYAGSHTSIVILDACRNNPLSRGFRSATRGLARMDAPNGSYVAYSTAPGEVAADGTGKNSPFALALVAEITKPGQGIEEAFRNVRVQVTKTTNGAQTPWDSSSLMNPFYFSGEKQVAATEVTTPAANMNEALFWQSIMNSTRASDFAAYLKKYPSGDFADLARIRLDELKAPEPQQKVAIVPAAPATDTKSLDLAYWNAVKNSEKVADFEAYLKKYPDGAFADLAQNKVKKLKGASGAATVETAPAASGGTTVSAAPAVSGKPPAPPKDQLASPDHPGWIVDSTNGCWVWDGAFHEQMTVTWSGSCDANGRATGIGTKKRVWPGGASLYEGELVAGKKSGFGKGNWPDGSYEGQFLNDNYEGKGKEIWGNGDNWYDGMWSVGLPNGTGKAKFGRDYYSGQWKKGCLFKGGQLEAWYSDEAKKACQ